MGGYVIFECPQRLQLNGFIDNDIIHIKSLAIVPNTEETHNMSKKIKMDRYILINIWKILEGHDKEHWVGFKPNDDWTMEGNERRCLVEHTTNEDSIHFYGPNLFNSRPRDIRNLTKCTTEDFVRALDPYLCSIDDDQQEILGFIEFSNASSGESGPSQRETSQEPPLKSLKVC